MSNWFMKVIWSIMDVGGTIIFETVPCSFSRNKEQLFLSK